jgi:hypothetical protein
MKSFGDKHGRRSILTASVVLFVLAGSGTAFALAGGTSLVSSHDDGAATGRAAQSLGTLSATPPPGNGVQNEVVSGGQGSAPQNTTGNAPTGNTPAGNTVVPAGSNASSLPFTGLLAIPVLLLGVALLLGGAVARRRVAAGPATT